jgi:hypothetical protein
MAIMDSHFNIKLSADNLIKICIAKIKGIVAS